jgi:hypothetical protein
MRLTLGSGPAGRRRPRPVDLMTVRAVRAVEAPRRCSTTP